MGKDPMITRANSRDAALESYRNDTKNLTENVEHTESTPIPDNYDGPIREFKEPVAETPKKSKFPTIMLSILAILLVIMGGLAIWYFAYYSNPERVVLDAVNKFANADHIVVQDGNIFVVDNDRSDGYISSLSVQFDSSSAKLPNATNVSVDFKISPVESEPIPENICGEEDDPEATDCIVYEEPEQMEFHAELGATAITDGTVYLQLSGLVDSLEQAGMTAETTPELTELLATLETVEGDWWRISLTEILDSFGTDDETKSIYTDVYACMLDLAASGLPAELGDLYAKYPFLNVAKSSAGTDGYSYFDVSFKSAELANFLNAIPETTAMNDYYACFNQIEAFGETIGAEDYNEVTPEEVADFIAELPENFTITLGISNFTHELRYAFVSASTSRDDYNDILFITSVTFAYQPTVVTEPEEYRSITELFPELYGTITYEEPTQEY